MVFVLPCGAGAMEYVTQDQLQAQEKLFRELIRTQEESYKTFLTLYMDSTNKRVDVFMTKVTCDISGLRHSLEFSQAEIADMKTSASSNPDLQQRIEAIQANCNALESQIEYIDNYTRRNSLVIRGILESDNESWTDTEVKVRDMIKSQLQLDDSKIEIDRAHRAGSGTVRPRNIAIRLLRFKDKQDILTNAKKLKGKGIFINESFSDKVNNRRSALWPEVKSLRREGKIAYLSYDKLVCRDRNDSQNNEQDSGDRRTLRSNVRRDSQNNANI